MNQSLFICHSQIPGKGIDINSLKLLLALSIYVHENNLNYNVKRVVKDCFMFL